MRDIEIPVAKFLKPWETTDCNYSIGTVEKHIACLIIFLKQFGDTKLLWMMRNDLKSNATVT